MSNISDLTNKILEDAKINAEQTIDEAKEKEKNIINDKVRMAEEEKKKILYKAKIESEIRAERIISNANLQVRDMKLSAKVEALDKVFDATIQELTRMTQGELLNFIKKSILSLDIDGDEEFIIAKNNTNITPEFISELNQALKAKGKLGNLKLGADKRNIQGGYILAKNGIEINNTFESLVKSLRDDIETEVARVLFS